LQVITMTIKAPLAPPDSSNTCGLTVASSGGNYLVIDPQITQSMLDSGWIDGVQWTTIGGHFLSARIPECSFLGSSTCTAQIGACSLDVGTCWQMSDCYGTCGSTSPPTPSPLALRIQLPATAQGSQFLTGASCLSGGSGWCSPAGTYCHTYPPPTGCTQCTYPNNCTSCGELDFDVKLVVFTP